MSSHGRSKWLRRRITTKVHGHVSALLRYIIQKCHSGSNLFIPRSLAENGFYLLHRINDVSGHVYYIIVVEACRHDVEYASRHRIASNIMFDSISWALSTLTYMCAARLNM